MGSFRGYILNSQLSKKAGVSHNLFQQIQTVKTKKMGGIICILKSSLPQKYQEAAKECLDLTNWWSFSYLSRELNMSKDYLAQVSLLRPIISKKVDLSRFFKLSDEFVEEIEKGNTPYVIRYEKDKAHAIKVITMQGITIGFY